MVTNELYKSNYLDIKKEEWNNFVENSLSGWFWHTSFFLDAWPYGNNISFAIRDDKEILAICSLWLNSGRMTRRIFYIFKQIATEHTLFSLGGIAVKDGLGKKHKNRIISFFKIVIDGLMHQYGCCNFEIVSASLPPILFPENNIHYNPLIFWGFKNISEHTYIIDLNNSNEEEIKNDFSNTTKLQIRKIIDDKSYSFREAKPCKEDLDLYYKLHCETYTRTGTTPHPISYFKHIFSEIMEKGFCRVLFAFKYGEIVAAQNTLSYKGASFYWTGASITEKDNGVNKYLFYSQIMYAKRKGDRYYEIGEIFPYERDGKLKGLTQFKSSFGGNIYPVYKGKFVY